ncbi:MAG TPA: transposase [Blastocatellia bacterium]|nr:transposase [Blastocatellia bacterium]
MSEPFNPGMKQSVIGALGLEGPLPALVVDGASNREVFDLCVEFFLVPQLRPGELVLMDNVKFHESKRALELIRAAGAGVEHLPAYSPDFNPIEELISRLREALRSVGARTKLLLRRALGRAHAAVTVQDIRGWFVFSFRIELQDASDPAGSLYFSRPACTHCRTPLIRTGAQSSDQLWLHAGPESDRLRATLRRAAAARLRM